MPRTLYKELGHERLTVSTSAVPFASVPTGATYALIKVKGTAGQGVCFRTDGTAPTSATGMEAEVGEYIQLDSFLGPFKAIRRDGADITLVVAYYTSTT